MNMRDFDRACELLPEGVTWGEAITPSIVKHIAEAALAAQAQQSQWISVEERLPDSDREVIGACWREEFGRSQRIFCCYDADDDDGWLSYGDATPYPIRYWMEPPLPPAPEGE